MAMKDRSSALRERLVQVGLEELRHNGLGAVSIRAVAARAGVSHAAPGYVFGDRAGLLTAMAARGFELLRDHLKYGTDKTLTTAPTMVEVGLRYLDFARREPEIYRLLFSTDEIRRAEPHVAQAGAAAFEVLERSILNDGLKHTRGLAPVLAWAVVHGLASLDQAGALESQYTQTVGRETAELSLLHWVADVVGNRDQA